MGREIVLFKSEEKKDLPSVATFLRQLADKLDGNRVVLRQGGDHSLNLGRCGGLAAQLEAEDRFRGWNGRIVVRVGKERDVVGDARERRRGERTGQVGAVGELDQGA